MKSRRVSFKESELTLIHELIHDQIDNIRYILDDLEREIEVDYDLIHDYENQLEDLKIILVKTI